MLLNKPIFWSLVPILLLVAPTEAMTLKERASYCNSLPDKVSVQICFNNLNSSLGPGETPLQPETHSSADIKQLSSSCSALTDKAARLDCYDRAAQDSGVPSNASEQPPAGDPATASTSDMLHSFSPTDYKNVDPDDLHVAPNKFMKKPVELRRVHCLYADVNEYRCLGSGDMVVLVIGSDIKPDDAKTRLENDCGAIKQLTTSRCERTIHFVPVANDEDHPNALMTRVVIMTPLIEIVPTRR